MILTCNSIKNKYLLSKNIHYTNLSSTKMLSKLDVFRGGTKENYMTK